MGSRKRHSTKQTETHQIEWLKHRTGYPSPEEREAIIHLRQEISSEFIKFLVAKVKPDDPRARAMYNKYGEEEVERAIKTIDDAMELPFFVADDARSYREYRRRYSRFGAGLIFYTPKEMDDLFDTYAEHLGNDSKASEVEKLLLMGWRDWEDITPPAVPPRPIDYAAPQPASYSAPINELLEWGDDLHKSHRFDNEAEYIQWKKYVPALTRMALDPGLLNGWPSDTASWAPWHAIHMLGNLQAWESAPALASLANLENDWLSDHLPHIWADMGREVEPTLWVILENTSASPKQRGLAAQSLHLLTEESEAMETKVIKGFEKILQNAKTFDPTLNSYLLYYLSEMEAVDEIRETIDAAFAGERVDLEVFTPEDLEYSDDELDDDFDGSDFIIDDLDDDNN